MLKVRVISGKRADEFEAAVNKAVSEIDCGFAGVKKIETYQYEDGYTAVIHYDTEYYTI